MNQVILVGNLGKEVRTAETQSGKIVATFSVATKGVGKEAPADWHNVVVWENLAETCAKYLKKGSKVGVVGRLQTRKYEKEGVEHYTTEVIGGSVEFLSSKSDTPQDSKGDTSNNIPF